MTKLKAYMGHVLFVDLTKKEVSEFPWTDEDRIRTLGGKIMAADILLNHIRPGMKAFDEDNWIVVTTGPLTRCDSPSSTRFNISTISPLTGILTSSNCGGNFGYYLKKAGMDALIIRGRSEKPVWIEINNDKFTIHEADDIWGMKTGHVQAVLDEKLTLPNGKVRKNGKIVIGPAGENLVRYASIVSNERLAGRGGTGAVMGWKNLKAITVSGNKTVPVNIQLNSTNYKINLLY